MADIDLPVLPFRINWAEGILERLSFLTTVLRGEEGAEQRFAKRLTPRRAVEADFLLSGPERTFYDLFIHRHSGSEVMAPLYWDNCLTSAVLSAGATDRIDFDTRWTEFAPGLAILQRNSALTFEVVEIAAVDDDGVDLVSPVLRQWPKMTRIMPLRRAVIADMGSLTHHSATVASIATRIAYAVANPREIPEDDSTIYESLPVFPHEPNWIETLDVGYEREIVRLDNDTGLPYQVDPTGRANLGQAHRWLLRNRQQKAAFRDFLYRQEGRRGAFWLPTFKGDLELAATAASGSTQLVVKEAGLVYTAVPASGRERLAIFPRGAAPILRQITSTANGLTAGTERVNLGSAVGLDLSPGQARKISFLDTAHFDQDEFEIDHRTSTVGEVTAAFRTFKDSRDPSGVINYPIPAAVMTTDPCGDTGDCYAGGPVFEGWYVEFRLDYGLFAKPTSVPGVLTQSMGSGEIVNGSGTGSSKIVIWDEENCYLIYRLYDPDSYDPQQRNLRLQFGASTVPIETRASYSARRWDAEYGGGLSPLPGSWSTGNPFDVRSLWPDDWFFFF